MRLSDTLEPDPWHFPRPHLADAYLAAFELELSPARGLFARRRMGKTEFLLRDLAPAALKRGYLVAYTNLWEMRAAPEAALVSALAYTLEPKSADAARAAADLRGILKRLDSRKKPLLLLLDEAQLLARAEHGKFAHALRAALDIRRTRIKAIFAGGSEAALRDMLARTSAPFYNWAVLEPLPLLGEEFVAFTIRVVNGMARHGLSLRQGEQAFDALHRTPAFFKRFIERYMLYQTQGADAALAYTKASVFSDEHFLAQWSSMHPADRAVLTLLAQGSADVHGAAGIARLSAMLGKSVTKNTGAHALKRLRDGDIVSHLAFGEYRIEDEAFAEWIRRRASPADRRGNGKGKGKVKGRAK